MKFATYEGEVKFDKTDDDEPGLSCVCLRFTSRLLLTFAAQCNNATMLVVLKNDLHLDMFASSMVMSFTGLLCGITSLVSAEIMRRDWITPYATIVHAPVLMVFSCVVRAMFLKTRTGLALSILLDCLCGTWYYPAFDAVLVSTSRPDRVGRIVALRKFGVTGDGGFAVARHRRSVRTRRSRTSKPLLGGKRRRDHIMARCARSGRHQI